MLRDLMFRAFMLEQWSIGWSNRTIGEFLSAPGAAENHWIRPSNKLWILADPFGAEDGEGITIFAESLVHGGSSGEIVCIRGKGSRSRASCISKPWHLSYPFLVSRAEERFLVPEQAESGFIAFYRIDDKFQVDRSPSWVLKGLPSLDPTFLYFQGHWWLFSSSLEDSPQNTYLYLHYAERLEGPYTSHPGNPIVRSANAARPAGRIVELGGRLFRPAQDCGSGYGAGINIAEILELTTKRYAERHHMAIRPCDIQGAFRNGVHHLDHTNNFVLFDSKRYVFQWNAWWLKLRERSARNARLSQKGREKAV
jgi:hypothetical protein